MKTFLLILCFCLTLALPLFAQEVDKLPTISVTGTAEILVAPDEVTFSLDITKRSMDLQIAKKESDEVAIKVLNLTKQYAISTENVKTTNVSVDRRFEITKDPKNRIYDEDGDEIGTRKFVGFEVSQTIIVKLKDLTKYEKFFDDVLKTGITEVNSATFENSNIIEHRQKARMMAMQAAKEKASAMTSAIGQNVGKAIKINEVNQTSNYQSNSYANTTANGRSFSSSNSTTTTASESVATFSPGAIPISVQVSVVFILN